jgi:hypothetical protein
VSTTEADKIGVLGRPPGGQLLDDADAADVVLLVDGARLQPRPFHGERRVGGGHEGHLDVLVQVDQPVLILGVSPPVLLAVGVADSWMRGHDDARAGAMHAGEP